LSVNFELETENWELLVYYAARMQQSPRNLLITGATGYLGRPLSTLALSRGHGVRAFVRSGSESRAAIGTTVVSGNPFAADELARALTPDTTLVHLIGTPRPSPSKAREFRDVDLASTRSAATAAARAGVAHIVYVSVAHPAPVMKAYQAARIEGEALVRATGIPATILRPWYVLGPNHWWPYALLPFYWVYERLPSKRETALRLGLVTHLQMITALMGAVEQGPDGVRTIEVPAIRAAALK
jgi:uncharacterized protein YbjT (DUF2867 family)